jgi:hypothetical protein
MILKRTKSLKQTAAAMAWVGSYLDEVQKHGGAQEVRAFAGDSSRPAGFLTAHGYIRRSVDELRRQEDSMAFKSPDRRAANNRAIQEFVRRHCRAQRERKRKTIGLRFVASLDPAQVRPLLSRGADLDRLLVAAIDRTFETLARNHYPADELGYIIGLHHDALDRLGRPHLHAHVLLLPQTRKGVLISVSNHSRPGRDGHYTDMLAEAKNLFRDAAMDLVYASAPSRYQTYAAPTWDDLARESSLQTVEAVAGGRQMNAEQTRKFAISTFFFHVRKTTGPWLERRLQKLKDRIGQLASQGRDRLVATARDLSEGLMRLMRPRFGERRVLANRTRTEFEQERVVCEAVDCRLKQVRTCLSHWRTAGNRRARIEKLLQEIDSRRMAARISMLGELSLIDLHLAAAGLMASPPAWMQRLELAARNDRLPNRELVEATHDGMKQEAATEADLPLHAPPGRFYPILPTAGGRLHPAITAKQSNEWTMCCLPG